MDYEIEVVSKQVVFVRADKKEEAFEIARDKALMKLPDQMDCRVISVMASKKTSSEPVCQKAEEDEEETSSLVKRDSKLQYRKNANVALNEETFPDESFRMYLTRFDIDNDGVLCETERAAVTEIDTWNTSIAVKDYTGLSFFPNLKTLKCSPIHTFVTLDVSGNTALETLYCLSCEIGFLDLSCNPALKELNLYKSALSSLSVSENPALEHMQISATGLKTLELSGAPALKTLLCNNNPLETLDLGMNKSLRHIDISGCSRLNTLDVSACSLLTDALKNGNYKASFFSWTYYTEEAFVSFSPLQISFFTDSVVADFDANGGNGCVKTMLIRPKEFLVLPECTYTVPEGKKFLGWKIGEMVYQPGEKIIISKNLTVFAVWKDSSAQEDPLRNRKVTQQNDFLGCSSAFSS